MKYNVNDNDQICNLSFLETFYKEKKQLTFLTVFYIFHKSGIKNWEMLMSALTALVNNPFQERFDTTFMGNEKSCQNINYFFSFPIKTFFKWIIN